MAESCVMLHVQRLPEGGYLATSEAIQGLVAQGRTVVETLEIARDVAQRLLELLLILQQLGEKEMKCWTQLVRR